MTPYLSMYYPVCLGGKFCGLAMQREPGFYSTGHPNPQYGQANRGWDADGEKPASTEHRQLDHESSCETVLPGPAWPLRAGRAPDPTAPASSPVGGHLG